MVGEMALVDVVASVDANVTLDADQRQIFCNRDGAVVEKHMMVRAQAEDVALRVWTVVRCAERAYVSSF
jgi:hypothetical protein